LEVIGKKFRVSKKSYCATHTSSLLHVLTADHCKVKRRTEYGKAVCSLKIWDEFFERESGGGQ
jgi:hypothetical protein